MTRQKKDPFLPKPLSAHRTSGTRGQRGSRKLLGLPTRGKTAPNRLRPTDTYLALCHAEFIRTLPGFYVDLGFGETPQTTLESAARLRRINPDLPFLGVEIDPVRVAAAQDASGPGLEFRLGGFNLPLRSGEGAGIIRAMNVLRQYPESEYSPSIGLLEQYLCEGGLLLEGTSDPPGRLMVFHVYRRTVGGTIHDGLVFFARLRHPFAPRDWQAVLPKDLIHHAQPGGSLDKFFGEWEACWRRAYRRAPRDPRHCFRLAAQDLAEDFGLPVDRRSILLSRGFLRLAAIPLYHPLQSSLL
jgi:hypothetical protein